MRVFEIFPVKGGWQGTCPLHFESVKTRSLIFLSYSSLEVFVCVKYTIQSTIKLSYIVPSYMDIVYV